MPPESFTDVSRVISFPEVVVVVVAVVVVIVVVVVVVVVIIFVVVGIVVQKFSNNILKICG